LRGDFGRLEANVCAKRHCGGKRLPRRANVSRRVWDRFNGSVGMGSREGPAHVARGPVALPTDPLGLRAADGVTLPAFNYTGISIMHTPNNCAPPSREATVLRFLRLCTTIFIGNTKKRYSFLRPKKSALQLCFPRPAKRRPFNYAGANFFG